MNTRTAGGDITGQLRRGIRWTGGRTFAWSHRRRRSRSIDRDVGRCACRGMLDNDNSDGGGGMRRLRGRVCGWINRWISCWDGNGILGGYNRRLMTELTNVVQCRFRTR